ncbi:MAG: hypothetical protein ABI475_11480 [Methylophilaceae bacterium]
MGDYFVYIVVFRKSGFDEQADAINDDSSGPGKVVKIGISGIFSGRISGLLSQLNNILKYKGLGIMGAAPFRLN